MAKAAGQGWLLWTAKTLIPAGGCSSLGRNASRSSACYQALISRVGMAPMIRPYHVMDAGSCNLCLQPRLSSAQPWTGQTTRTPGPKAQLWYSPCCFVAAAPAAFAVAQSSGESRRPLQSRTRQRHKGDTAGRGGVVEMSSLPAQRLGGKPQRGKVQHCVCPAHSLSSHVPNAARTGWAGGTVTAASSTGSWAVVALLKAQAPCPSWRSRSGLESVLLGETFTPQISLGLHWPLNLQRKGEVTDFIWIGLFNSAIYFESTEV